MSEPLTDDELREMREREQAATPGPWHAVQICNWWHIQDGPRYDDNSVIDEDERPEAAASATFITHAREDIPRLLDFVDGLRTRYENAVRDHCEEDTAIRDIARPVLGDAAVDGDSDARPTAVDVVRMVVDRLRADNRQMTNANAHLQQEVNFLRRRPE